jgi:hypothetical protein
MLKKLRLYILILMLIGGCAAHKYRHRKKPCDCPNMKDNLWIKSSSEILFRNQRIIFYSKVVEPESNCIQYKRLKRIS